MQSNKIIGYILASITLFFVALFLIPTTENYKLVADNADAEVATTTTAYPLILDTALYDKKLNYMAHVTLATSTLATTTASTTKSTSVKKLWPVKTVYPDGGAILPFKRIVAYYGNFYSKGMGVLGQYPTDVMLAKLRAEVDKWNKADKETPVLPAIDYIAVTAQGSAGKDGKYRLRMPDKEIDHALELAKQVDGIVILDIQVGLSNLETELPLLEKYLKLPNVHLAIDPEFSMKFGDKPGSVIGTFNASDINYAANYLAKLVRENKLTPKVLVVHRFTHNMVTGYKSITPLKEVQIVMDMDGWGSPAKKKGTYNQVIYPEPVQFTGFKLFYKNDLLPPSTRMLTYDEVISMTPAPLFIQYQ